MLKASERCIADITSRSFCDPLSSFFVCFNLNESSLKDVLIYTEDDWSPPGCKGSPLSPFPSVCSYACKVTGQELTSLEYGSLWKSGSHLLSNLVYSMAFTSIRTFSKPNKTSKAHWKFLCKLCICLFQPGMWKSSGISVKTTDQTDRDTSVQSNNLIIIYHSYLNSRKLEHIPQTEQERGFVLQG